MGKIIVPALPIAREMGRHCRRHLQSLANDEESAFRGALDLDVSHIYMRAQAYGVRIIDVDICAESIGVSYEGERPAIPS